MQERTVRSWGWKMVRYAAAMSASARGKDSLVEVLHSCGVADEDGLQRLEEQADPTQAQPDDSQATVLRTQEPHPARKSHAQQAASHQQTSPCPTTSKLVRVDPPNVARPAPPCPDPLAPSYLTQFRPTPPSALSYPLPNSTPRTPFAALCCPILPYSALFCPILPSSALVYPILLILFLIPHALPFNSVPSRPTRPTP